MSAGLNLEFAKKRFEMFFSDSICLVEGKEDDESFHLKNEEAKQNRDEVFGIGTTRNEIEMLMPVPLMYQGWELDEWGWVVKIRNEVKLVLTTNGKPYMANAEELTDYMLRYSEAYNLTVKALIELDRLDLIKSGATLG